MFKRLVVAAAVPVALSGCLPLPVSIASTAISGMSYITTGKSSTDHVISASRKEDCALTNPVFGDPVCIEIKGDSPYENVAAYPGDQDDTGLTFGDTRNFDQPIETMAAQPVDLAISNSERLASLSRLRPEMPETTVAGFALSPDLPDQIAAADQDADPNAGQAPVMVAAATDTGWTPAVPTREVKVAPLPAPVRQVPLANPRPAQTTAPEATKGVEKAEPVRTKTADIVTITSEPKWQKLPSKTPEKSSAPVEPETVTPKTVVSTEANTTRRAETGASEKGVGDRASDRYVIVGSFRSADRAERLAESLSEDGTLVAVLAAKVKGERWNRVAFGPFTPDQAKAKKSELGTVSGKTPWIVRLDTPRQVASR